MGLGERHEKAQEHSKKRFGTLAMSKSALIPLLAMRWPNGPVCPKCGHGEHYYLATQKRWKCKKCSKQFSVKVGTIFEDSPISLDKWLAALWMLVNCKNGISSYEVGRDLGLTQKSAWFVLHRLRLGIAGEIAN